jgi:KDO2-lipid IV(A) lauroyltransferase
MNAWERLQYRLLHTASRRLAAGGLSGIRRLGVLLGALLWLILPGRRKLAARAIAARLDLPEAEARALARRSFEHNARSFLEIVLAPGFDLHRPELRLDDPDRFERLRLCERPIVVATAHLGAWEFTAGLADDFNPSRSRMIVVRNHGNAAVRAWMADMRGGGKRQVVGHRNATFAALKTLRKNGVVGFLVDHNCGRNEAVFLPFLGRIAAVNIGPAVLAVRADALVLPLFLLRRDDRRNEHYLLLTEEPLDTATLPGNHEERALAVARFYTEAVERHVRAWPEQWFWMHQRWKTRPPGEK